MSQQWLSDQYSADDSATEVAAKTEATAIEDGDPVRIMGNLTLPPISMSPFSANPDIRHTIEAVLPHIRKLDSRDLRTLPDRIRIDEAFETFIKDEALAWKKSSREPDKRCNFVKASGSFDAPLAHYLHQPSMTSFRCNDRVAETADSSNGCVAMVMQNGFKKDETLIFDHLHRRSFECEDIENYPEEVLAVHEKHTHDIMASSASKVVLTYGKHVQARLTVLASGKMTAFPLWGPFSGVFLFLLHEDYFHNQDTNYKFRKALIFTAHPQHMFYQPKGSKTAILQDLALRAALLISRADLKDNYDATYYQSYRFRYKLPTVAITSLERAKEIQAAREQPKAQPNFTSAIPNMHTVPLELRRGIDWNDTFYSYTHSNTTCRSLLPLSIAALKDVDENYAQHPLELPQAAREWFCGTKTVFFGDSSISNIEDIRVALRESTTVNQIDIQQLRLVGLLRLLANAQESFLHLQKQNKLDDFIYNRLDGQTMQTSCPCGNLKANDQFPRYLAKRSREYVLRLSGKPCGSSICGSPRKTMKPASYRQIPWISENACSTQSKKTRHYGERYDSLLHLHSKNSSLPSKIESWCVKCKDKTKTVEGHAVFIDTKPRWTIGIVRHLYVERQAVCLNHIWSRFVPKTSEILSISTKRLINFAELFQHEGIDNVVKACILDSWPESTRTTRKERKLKPCSSRLFTSNIGIRCPHPKCDKQFRGRRELLKHQRITHLNERWVCEGCNKEYSQKCHAWRHQGRGKKCSGAEVGRVFKTGWIA